MTINLKHSSLMIKIENMNKVLFIATTNLNNKDGGALGQVGHLASCKYLTNNNLGLVMPEETKGEKYAYAIGAPHRPLWKSLFSGSIHRYKKFLHGYLSEHQDEYNICIINGGIYAGDMMDMLHSFGLKVVVFHLNYEPDYQMDNKSLWTLRGRIDYFVKKNERKAYLKADFNCFMTTADKELFAKNYGKASAPDAIIGCYETSHIEQPMVSLPTSFDKAIAITGSMNTLQTLCGIREIRDRYYSIMKEVCPDWNVVIAGRNPADEIYDFERKNQHVKVIANPESMDDIINNAAIFLCPTNVGGGIKLRLMDGLKHGRPVLVHHVSARGYESLFNEPFFRVYYDEKSFRTGLEDLANYVENDFNPSVIVHKYLAYFSFEAGTQRYKKVFDTLSSKEL